MSHVWYVSYGSNLSADRFACYIVGGVPPGGSRANPGARDRRLPERTIPVDLPGTGYFAGESPQWGGGVAFYTRGHPDNVYLAYPGSHYQIEVFDPSPGRAQHLVAAGRRGPEFTARRLHRRAAELRLQPGLHLHADPDRRAG